MAKTKVYFWLKFDKKFFENIFIKRLKGMPGGYTMTVIYIRLMLESLESDCILYYEGYFENLKTELAIKLDVTEDDINMTMAYFTKCGLIQIDSDGNAELPQAKAMLEQETNQAQYMREYRKNKALQKTKDNIVNNQDNNVSEALTSCKTEIDIDKDIEIESDISNHILSINNKQEIYKYFENKTGRLVTPLQTEKFENELARLVPSLELVKKAIDETVATHDSKKYNLAYLTGILRNWGSRGWTAPEMVENAKREYEESKKTSKEKPSAEFLEAMDLWKD